MSLRNNSLEKSDNYLATIVDEHGPATTLLVVNGTAVFMDEDDNDVAAAIINGLKSHLTVDLSDSYTVYSSDLPDGYSPDDAMEFIANLPVERMPRGDSDSSPGM